MSYLSQPRSVARVAEREALEQRRVAGDASGHAGRLDVVATEVESIRTLAEVPLVGEIAFELAGAGAHAKAALRTWCVASEPVLPSPVELDRGDCRIRHLGAGRRREWLELRNAHARGEADVRGEGELQQRGDRRSRLVRRLESRARARARPAWRRASPDRTRTTRGWRRAGGVPSFLVSKRSP